MGPLNLLCPEESLIPLRLLERLYDYDYLHVFVIETHSCGNFNCDFGCRTCVNVIKQFIRFCYEVFRRSPSIGLQFGDNMKLNMICSFRKMFLESWSYLEIPAASSHVVGAYLLVIISTPQLLLRASTHIRLSMAEGWDSILSSGTKVRMLK
ncbi:hypothetical protein IC582_023239 [Cucumis melo]